MFFVAHLTKINQCLKNRVLRLVVGNSGVVAHAEPRPAAMAWKDDERFAVHAANGGLDVILCPAHFLYLDIVQEFNFEDKSLCQSASGLESNFGLESRDSREMQTFGQ